MLAALLAALPFVAGDFYVNLASQILIAAIFALSLNLLVGYGGMTSLGHASFLGVAAYLAALLTTRYGFGHPAAALLSIAGTTLTAAFFGVIALRATGLGLSYNIGVTAFGGMGPAIMTWLGSFALIGDLAPGYYLTVVCVLSLLALVTIRRTAADCYA